jgi:hypothetical protein
MHVKQMGFGLAGKGYGAVVQNPGAWLLSDAKTSIAEIICFRGKTCKKESIDDGDELVRESHPISFH